MDLESDQERRAKKKCKRRLWTMEWPTVVFAVWNESFETTNICMNVCVRTVILDCLGKSYVNETTKDELTTTKPEKYWYLPLCQLLPAVLSNLQMFRYVLTADIWEMFHRPMIREEDRQFHRYLLWDRPNVEPKVFEILGSTFPRVPINMSTIAMHEISPPIIRKQ